MFKATELLSLHLGEKIQSFITHPFQTKIKDLLWHSQYFRCHHLALELSDSSSPLPVQQWTELHVHGAPWKQASCSQRLERGGCFLIRNRKPLVLSELHPILRLSSLLLKKSTWKGNKGENEKWKARHASAHPQEETTRALGVRAEQPCTKKGLWPYCEFFNVIIITLFI